MAKDYTVISRKIVEQIGGIDNIANVTHCMTRLRFVLKDETLADDEAVKAIDGVMGLVKQGGQYQIIIGNHVGTAYQEVLKLGNFGEQSEIAKGEKKEPLTLKKVGNNILDAIVGTMSPLIPAIIGGLGGAVCECLAEKAPVPVKRIGINDVYGESGPAVALLEKYGLDAAGIYKQIKAFI